jgi:hypothetical protein
MAALREAVLRRNIFDWTLDVLDSMVGLHLTTPTPAPQDVATAGDGTTGAESGAPGR